MKKLRSKPDNGGGPRLKDVRIPIILVECPRCDLKGSYDRAALLKLHGAGLSFSRLRRRAAMGCEHMTGPDGDQCQTRFPCVDLERQ